MSELTLDPSMKMSWTDTHVFFLNGPFSQWWLSHFSAPLTSDGEMLNFHCAEQYMMARKAELFGDPLTRDTIMAVKQTTKWQDAPRQCKELGRKVHGLKGGAWDAADIALWQANARPVVLAGNIAKFSQNPDLRGFLMGHRGKMLVEGAWYDRIWGVGLAWDDPKIADPRNWRGQNLLGEILMEVQTLL